MFVTAGEEENWNEEDEKNAKTTPFEKVTKDGSEKEDHAPSSTTPRPEELKPIKMEPESEPSPDRTEAAESVIKKVGPCGDTDLKIASPPTIKNEPSVSPVPSTISINEQEYIGLPQSLPSGIYDYYFMSVLRILLKEKYA